MQKITTIQLEVLKYLEGKKTTISLINEHRKKKTYTIIKLLEKKELISRDNCYYCLSELGIKLLEDEKNKTERRKNKLPKNQKLILNYLANQKRKKPKEISKQTGINSIGYSLRRLLKIKLIKNENHFYSLTKKGEKLNGN